MKKLNQYKAHVDSSLSRRINTMIENIEPFDIYKGYADCLSEDVHPIEGNFVSGWIPRQDGGLIKTFLFSLTEDSSHHFTTKQTDCINEYIEDNPEVFNECDEAFEPRLGYSDLDVRCYVKDNKIIFGMILEYLGKTEELYYKEFSFKEFKELDWEEFIENLHNTY